MRFIFYLLYFISFSSYSSLYVDDNYDLVFEKNGKISEKYDVFNDVKLKLKNGDISKDSIYISISKEKNKYVLSTDLFSSRYYEDFDISDDGNNNFVIRKITYTSVDKADFDSKTVTCVYNVNIPIKKFKHGMNLNSPENCIITYPLENDLPSFESYVSSIYKDKNYLSGIDKDRLDSYISRYPLKDDNVNYYNNIAFYLIEGGFPKPAICLLENIVNKFKDREVAYINLGDAYLAINERDKALQMYSIYVLKMKKKGKEKKIPSRVLNMLDKKL